MNNTGSLSNFHINEDLITPEDLISAVVQLCFWFNLDFPLFFSMLNI